ncbi:MAG: helix-turn-helix domain-containing protein [Ligilactobacillus agilis]|uniref:BglG family transcription antiterminator n=1 Tax=Ligilactobacillus agilis TaxID=1601 RepID=UPI00242EAEE7|nr:helix-turn-helix domain-containing protein [Ligilactobacillus agilis]MCI5761495.1 helix-turn-helix domain-containing protein [Ligilactobacillus agilis]MDY4064143.1 helix-turn-helix domain-containing protein [Ligilactobacillus agilis]
MVKLTQRQEKLLTALAESGVGLSLKDLEGLMKVSRRTIYREFADLKLYLQSQGVAITNDNGLYRLTGQVAKLDGVFEDEVAKQELTTAKRESILACQLLLAGQATKIISLALSLKVSEGTIQRDLTKLERSLSQYDLHVIKQKGVGVYIEGNEAKRRQVLTGILLNELNEYYFLRYVQKGEEIAQFKQLFLDAINPQIFRQVYQGLSQTILPVVELNSDRQMIQLILIAAISIKRAQLGKHPHASKTKDNLRYLAKVYEFFATLDGSLRAKLTTDEALFIASQIHLRDYSEQQFDLNEDQEWPLTLKVRQFVLDVSKDFGWNFQRNPDFFKRLTRHILNLEKNSHDRLPNVQIETLQTLTTKYQGLYNSIMKCWLQNFELRLVIPEYQLILLYFANEYTNRRYLQDLAALIVCENGIGTANILASRLKKELPEIKRVSITHLAVLGQVDLQQYDLILSTLELPGFPREYQLVSPLLLNDEVKRLKDYLANYHRPDYGQVKTSLVKHKNALKKLSQMKAYLDLSLKLITQTQVHKVANQGSDLGASVEETLAHIPGEIINDKEEVTLALLRRINLAPIGIPDTNLALLHTSDAGVNQCYFGIYELAHPIKMLGMDREEMQVSRYTLMVAPKEVTDLEQKVLGIISSSIVMNSENTNVFETGTSEAVQELLANQLLNEIPKGK